MTFPIGFVLFLVLSAGIASAADHPPVFRIWAEVDKVYPEVDALYRDLHQNPELSLHEQKTASKLAERLRRAGYEVTTGVGGTGVVGVMRNGLGPAVMIRTDMDALPVEEKTGLPYASRLRTKDDAGADVPVMHACGHDVHMSSWIGAAEILAAGRDGWRGTLVMVGQPAEEKGMGARAMLADGLFTRFPHPDFAIALHDTNLLPAGKVGHTPGYALASSTSVNITIFGKGGHGAAPQTAIDPIVIAARTVLALQTIVSRENDPQDPAVVTVGAIHGGTKNNIIPDEVQLQLSVRAYKEEVRQRVLAAIERIAKAEAAAAGAPSGPLVKVVEFAPATYNDPEVTKRIGRALAAALGQANTGEVPPVMVSEDFSEYGRAGVPSVLFWVGAAEPAKFQAAKAAGTSLPSWHSALFAPDRESTLRTAVAAEVTAARELLGKP